MKRAVIHFGNRILAEAVERGLNRTGSFLVCNVVENAERDILSACEAVMADILLMDVSRAPQMTFSKRMATIAQVRKRCPGIRVALFCDSTSDSETAEKVTRAKAEGVIDMFFYESVSLEYLAAVLSAM